MARTPITVARAVASARTLSARRPVIRNFPYSVQFAGGSSNYQQINSANSATDLFAGGGTFIAWIYLDASGIFSTVPWYSPTAGVQGWSMQFDSPGSYPKNRLRFVSAFDGANGTWKTPVNSLAYNAWNCIIIAYNSDSASNDPVITINGVNQTISETSTPVGTYKSDSTKNWRSSSVAGCFLTFGEQRWIKGKAWNLTEMQNYYFDAQVASGGTPVVTVLMNEGVGAQANDTSGNNNHILFNGTYKWSTFAPPFCKARTLAS